VLSEAAGTDLLGMLHARAYDIHSLTRAAALKAWISLARHAAIPSTDLSGIAELAVDRLQDKAAYLRRAAAQLLRALVEHNPFGPHASAIAYAEQEAAATTWLKQHASSQEAGATAVETAPAEASSVSQAKAMLDEAEAQAVQQESVGEQPRTPPLRQTLQSISRPGTWLAKHMRFHSLFKQPFLRSSRCLDQRPGLTSTRRFGFSPALVLSTFLVPRLVLPRC